MMKLFLASTSPRRQELLKKLRVPFEVIRPRFQEAATTLSPEEEALYFAEMKARSVAQQCPKALILGSDTLVVCNGKKLGKPKDSREATAMLQRLSGKTHQLFTAVVLLNTATGEIKKHVEKVEVTFRQLHPEEVEQYVATGEPLDKAGAYAIQGEAKNFVQKIDGDKDSVVGLCLKPIKKWLMD